MANPLQIQSQSKLIEKRMQDIFFGVKSKYDQGIIKSKTEYLYQMYHALNTFYETIGKPTMQVRKANTTPSSKDYNLTIHEIYQDIKTLYEESQHLSDALSDSFQMVEVDRQNLDSQLKQIEDQMKDLSIKMNRRKGEILFRDGYIDSSQFDQEMIQDLPARIWTTEGVLTLNPRIAETYTEEVSVRILKGNGLPGNTKQTRSIAGELKFVGEESLHLNLADILDGNADTWFEYEAFSIRPRTLSDTSHLGYTYEEGISWLIDQGSTLSLTLEIELPTARTVNWFSLNPFIPNMKGSAAAVIERIEIQDGKGGVYVPPVNETLFSEEKIFMFGRQTAKRIIITLKQPNVYDTEVGHLFYKEVEKQQVHYMDRMKYKAGKRISGQLPSIENLGIRYDFESKEIIYPTVKVGHVMEKEEKVKANLFMVPKPKKGDAPSQSGFEALQASRYAIGIRDVGVANYQFESTSEYISTPFTAETPFMGVSLETEEDLPTEFPEGSWIEYSITPDNGKTWHRIHPRGATVKDAKVMYLFNTNTPQEGRLEQFGYIDQTEPINSLRLRIRLARPETLTNAPYYTPIVRDYRLRVITKGGMAT